MSQTFSTADVATHNKPDNLYVVVDEDVYDLTKFQDEHPGMFSTEVREFEANTMQVERRVRSHIDSSLQLLTRPVLQRVAGKDASKQFWKYHNEGILKKYKGQLHVGSLDTKKKEEPAPKPAPSASKEKIVPSIESGTVAVSPGPSAHEDAEAMDMFGDRKHVHQE